MWAITRLLMLITTPAAHKTGFSRDKTARTFEHKRIKFEQTYTICFHHVHQATIKQIKARQSKHANNQVRKLVGQGI